VPAELDDEYKGLNTVVKRCAAEGGLTAANLLELRTALGFGRLGKWVLVEIANALKAKKVGYFPTWVLAPEINEEPRQHQEVWLYLRNDSPTARVIDAVVEPQNHDVVRSTLVAVRLDNEPDLSAEQKLERIRAIVG
jgi:hypothetical protein